MAKTDEEKKYYVDNARLRQVIIEYNKINIDDKRWLVSSISSKIGEQVFEGKDDWRKI